MLNNFCRHVYAQKSRVIDENGNAFFGMTMLLFLTKLFIYAAAAPGPVTGAFIELVPS